MLEDGSRRRPPELLDDAIAECGALFRCQHGDAPIGKREAVLLEPIQPAQHGGHVLDDRIHHERMILPFDPRRGEAEDSEVRRETAPLRNLLRANAAMRGRQTHRRVPRRGEAGVHTRAQGRCSDRRRLRCRAAPTPPCSGSRGPCWSRRPEARGETTLSIQTRKLPPADADRLRRGSADRRPQAARNGHDAIARPGRPARGAQRALLRPRATATTGATQAVRESAHRRHPKAAPPLPTGVPSASSPCARCRDTRWFGSHECGLQSSPIRAKSSLKRPTNVRNACLDSVVGRSDNRPAGRSVPRSRGRRPAPGVENGQSVN